MDPRSRNGLRFFLLSCPISFYGRQAPNASKSLDRAFGGNGVKAAEMRRFEHFWRIEKPFLRM